MFIDAFIQPLKNDIPLVQSKNKRDENFNQLNRHMILHGEPIDYGTKINSLKALSLVNYIAENLNNEEVLSDKTEEL